MTTSVRGGKRGREIYSQKAKSKDYKLGYEAGNSVEGGNPREINPEMGKKS